MSPKTIKILVITVCTVLSGQQGAFSQSFEWVSESKERIEKMQNLELPANCGVDIIDKTVQSCKEIMDVTLAVSPIITNSYLSYFDYCQNTDSVDTNRTSPSLDELYGLGKEIAQLAGKLAELTSSVTNITNIVKTMTAKEVLSSSSNVKYLTKSLPSVGKELYLDFKLLGEMIKDKTGDVKFMEQIDNLFSWL